MGDIQRHLSSGRDDTDAERSLRSDALRTVHERGPRQRRMFGQCPRVYGPEVFRTKDVSDNDPRRQSTRQSPVSEGGHALPGRSLHLHHRLTHIFYSFSFIHSGYFYSASSSSLLLRGAPDYSIDTVSELTRRCDTGNYESQVPKWQLEWDSSPLPSGCNAQNLPLSPHANTIIQYKAMLCNTLLLYQVFPLQSKKRTNT